MIIIAAVHITAIQVITVIAATPIGITLRAAVEISSVTVTADRETRAGCYYQGKRRGRRRWRTIYMHLTAAATTGKNNRHSQ